MFHLAAWYQSVDAAGVYVNLNVVPDTQITASGSQIQVPTPNQIVALAGGACNTTAPRMRLSAPSLRQKSLFQISPLNVAGAAPALPQTPHKIVDLRHNPLQMVVSEQMQAQLLADPAAAQVQWALAWLASGPIAPIEGPVFTVRATGTTTLVIGTWTNAPLTFDENLPRGRYKIVGMKCFSANGIAARALIPGQQWRPGVMSSTLTEEIEWPGFRYGGMGEFGEFEDTDALNVEYLAAVADTAETVFFDMIQVRAGPG